MFDVQKTSVSNWQRYCFIIGQTLQIVTVTVNDCTTITTISDISDFHLSLRAVQNFYTSQFLGVHRPQPPPLNDASHHAKTVRGCSSIRTRTARWVIRIINASARAVYGRCLLISRLYNALKMPFSARRSETYFSYSVTVRQTSHQ